MLRAASHPPTFSEYSVLICPQSELDLQHTLASGQAFRWLRDSKGWWSAVISPDGTILRCWQDRDQIFYQTFPIADRLDVIRQYFQLDVDLPALEQSWKHAAGEEIGSALVQFSGLRVTMQDPVECLISFLCSSVAPIYRIRRGIDSMCRTLTAPIAEIHNQVYHPFPKLEVLASTSREAFDRMGLGFRGGNVRETARVLAERGGADYLLTLRAASYEEAKNALISLPGVGAKIADCVCLFSLRKNEAVPLDVHMNRVARRLFSKARTQKSMTDKVYSEIGDEFRSRFGEYAGWAQQYLFYNELMRSGAWDEEMGMHVPATKRLVK